MFSQSTTANCNNSKQKMSTKNANTFCRCQNWDANLCQSGMGWLNPFKCFMRMQRLWCFIFRRVAWRSDANDWFSPQAVMVDMELEQMCFNAWCRFLHFYQGSIEKSVKWANYVVILIPDTTNPRTSLWFGEPPLSPPTLGFSFKKKNKTVMVTLYCTVRCSQVWGVHFQQYVKQFWHKGIRLLLFITLNVFSVLFCNDWFVVFFSSLFLKLNVSN